MSKKTHILIQGALSLVLLFLVFRFIDFKDVVSTMKHVRPGYFFLIFMGFTLDRVLMAYKWGVLLRAKGILIPFWETLKIYYLATFVGFFLPTTVGGDALRTYKLYSQGHKGSEVLSTILMERVLGFVAAVLLAMISGIGLAVYAGLALKPVLYSLSVLFPLILLLFFFSLKIRIFGKTQSRILNKFYEIQEAYCSFETKRGVLLLFFMISFLEQGMPVIINFLIALSLNLPLPFKIFFLVIPVTQMINRLPVSFNGLGLNEGLQGAFFSLLRLSPSDGVSISLVGQVVLLIGTLPAVLFRIDARQITLEENRGS